MFISVKSNVKEVTRGMENLRKQIPFATSKAINAMAYQAQQALGKEIDDKIDRPTPFTRKSWLYKRSTKSKLEAVVYAKDIQSRYLRLQEDGGTRKPNRRAIAVPVKQRRNKYGNIPRTAISRMYNAGSRKYFSGVPKGGKQSTPGIYQRLGKDGRAQIRLMIKWQPEAQYKKKTDFEGVAARIVKAKFNAELRKQILFAVKTSR